MVSLYIVFFDDLSDDNCTQLIWRLDIFQHMSGWTTEICKKIYWMCVKVTWPTTRLRNKRRGKKVNSCVFISGCHDQDNTDFIGCNKKMNVPFFSKNLSKPKYFIRKVVTRINEVWHNNDYPMYA